jgi:hypothetical protein
MPTKAPLRFYFLAIAVWLSAASAFAQDPAEVTLKVSAAELKVIAEALDDKPTPQTLPLVVKLQAQIDAQFPPGPFATELPLPAILGRDQ